MARKIVRAIDDIIFESVDPVFTIPLGSLFFVEGVTEEGIVLEAETGERYRIDIPTFEAGFEIAAVGD